MLIFLEPWVPLEEGNKMTKWEDREPYAYLKGNSVVAATRQDFLKCNSPNNKIGMLASTRRFRFHLLLPNLQFSSNTMIGYGCRIGIGNLRKATIIKFSKPMHSLVIKVSPTFLCLKLREF